MEIIEFYENFIKEFIISEFTSWAVMHMNLELVYMRDIAENRPILSTADIDAASGMKRFCVTNVVCFNKFSYRAEMYTINGILSALNDGRIIITSYDVKK